MIKSVMLSSESVSPDKGLRFLFLVKEEDVELTEHRKWRLMVAILSLSLLTVMAGAAVAPALGIIKEYFSDEPITTVQLIISMPALFIAATNLFFGKLCSLFSAKKLTVAGLAMYVVFGCGAGLFSNIYLVLICRALLGIGVGIIMPMSTGLITFYFTRDKQDMLMGYSSAMNMMGGVVATLIAGVLAMVSWRLSFLVYLMGLICIILVIMWMPDEKISTADGKKKEKGTFRKYYPYIIGMFLLMMLFYNYPANFALEVSASGVIPEKIVAIVMALGDIFGFLGGLAYPKIKGGIGRNAKYTAPVLFLAGYIFLQLVGGAAGTLAGSFIIGFANGVGVPYLISTASEKAGRSAPTTVIPMLSIALYLAQFITPTVITCIKKLLGTFMAGVTSYHAALVVSVIFILWTLIFIDRKDSRTENA